jgi:hypothetical protein
VERRSRPRAESAADWICTAHVFGQTNARRGLRGGRYVLDQAHSAYLGAEWSGSADRRRPRGLHLEGDV